MGLSNQMMMDFFINHTRRHIVEADADAMFNVTKNLRELIARHRWSLDDHVEFVNSLTISHQRGCTLLIDEKYELHNWLNNLRYFLNPDSREYRDITFSDHVGPFGV